MTTPGAWPSVVEPGSPEGVAQVHMLAHAQKPEVPETYRRQARVTWASEIQMRPVTWAWVESGRERIPAGSLSIAAGREGTGKSTFGIWLAAQITRGTLPGNLHGKPRRVLYVAVEDSWEHTLAPRLAAADADLSMVGRFEVVQENQEDVILSLPLDNALLEETIREHDVALVVLDPLMSVISDVIDTNNSRKLRAALDPLAKLADRTRCLLLGIAHFNKSSGSDPSSLITGSGAFKDVPRSVFGFVRDLGDTDAHRVMTQTKNSLGLDGLDSLAYGIEPVEIATPEGPASVGRLQWLGVSDRSAQEILRDNHRTDDGDPEDAADAVTFLRDFLTERGGEASYQDIVRAGQPYGFNVHKLKRAKKKLGLEKGKDGMKGGWSWLLPPDLPPTLRTEERTEGSEERTDPIPAPFARFALPSAPVPCLACGHDLNSIDHFQQCEESK